MNVYQLDGCVKRIEDFYLEEVILFQLQQHIMELGESDRLMQEDKEKAVEAVEVLKKECRAAEKAVENAKKKSVYTDQTEHTARSFSASLPLVQCMLSGKQSNPLICLIMKGHISKTVSMEHLCRHRPCH
ncbi:hypothetical protein ACTNEF_16275 [Bariatricus sp. HCP28S3_E4]|uniref:hypothetical protein n=1 Tax=unclassified Bariatricus TaxID=2677046 RepID=UPI003F89286D